MKKALVIGLCSVVSSLAFAGDGEDAAPHATYPSPRLSGVGRVDFAANNVQLLGWKTVGDFAGNNASANDCWGYTSPSGREYALIGLSNGTGFVEITDPGNPTIVAFKSGVNSLWRGLKTYSHYAYAVSEGGGGIQVFDLASIDSGTVTLANTVLTGGCTTATHTLAIDEVSGYLYRAGGSGTPCSGGPQGLTIYSLANPALPAFVSSWNTRYVHECEVVKWDVPGTWLNKQIAFCFTETMSNGTDPRMTILDVTNKTAIVQLSSITYTGGQFSHQGWLSATKSHLYLNDEADESSYGPSRTRIFSLSSLTAPSPLGFFTTGSSSIDHNLYVKGNRIYEGNYRSGVHVFDNTSPTAPVRIGWFDTFPQDDFAQFNGIWSNYPYFNSGSWIGGDIEKGLFVWREGSAKLLFSYPAGIPVQLNPTGDQLVFHVAEASAGNLQAGSVKLGYSTGGAFTSVSASALGGGDYRAILPGFPCGTQVDFYVSAKSTDNVTWTDPPAAPTQVNIARAAVTQTVVFSDDLETNTGWVVNGVGDTATSGIWTRVDPVGTSAQPEDDHSATGTFCFVTGQGVVGGGLGDNDVDGPTSGTGGVTTLRTPILNAAGYNDPYISYWRWYSNNLNTDTDDTFLVDISNNGGTSWVPLEVVGVGTDNQGGWIHHEVRIASFVAPTNNMRLRFRASDNGVGSIVEAAVDDLEIIDIACATVSLASVSPASGPFEGGNVVTLTGTGFQSGITTVSFGGHPAPAVNVLSPTTLNVRVPRAPGPVGGSKLGVDDLKVDVSVQNPGADTLPSAYTYTLRQKDL